MRFGCVDGCGRHGGRPSRWCLAAVFVPAVLLSAPVSHGLLYRQPAEVDCDWQDGVSVRVYVRSRAGLKPDIRFRGKPITRMVDFRLETVAKAVGRLPEK